MARTVDACAAILFCTVENRLSTVAKPRGKAYTQVCLAVNRDGFVKMVEPTAPHEQAVKTHAWVPGVQVQLYTSTMPRKNMGWAAAPSVIPSTKPNPKTPNSQVAGSVSREKADDQLQKLMIEAEMAL